MKNILSISAIAFTLISCNQNNVDNKNLEDELQFNNISQHKSINKPSDQEEYYIFKGGYKMAKSEWKTPAVIEAATKAYGGRESALSILECYMMGVAEKNYYDDIKILFNPSRSGDNVEEYQRVFDKYNLKPILIKCVNNLHTTDNNGSLKEMSELNPNLNGKEYLVLHIKKEAHKAENWGDISSLINENSFFDCWAEEIIKKQGSADLQKVVENYFTSNQMEIDMEHCMRLNQKNEKESLLLYLKKEVNNVDGWAAFLSTLNEDSFFSCWVEEIFNNQGSYALQKLEEDYFSDSQMEIDMMHCFRLNEKARTPIFNFRANSKTGGNNSPGSTGQYNTYENVPVDVEFLFYKEQIEVVIDGKSSILNISNRTNNSFKTDDGQMVFNWSPEYKVVTINIGFDKELNYFKETVYYRNSENNK